MQCFVNCDGKTAEVLMSQEVWFGFYLIRPPATLRAFFNIPSQTASECVDVLFRNEVKHSPTLLSSLKQQNNTTVRQAGHHGNQYYGGVKADISLQTVPNN